MCIRDRGTEAQGMAAGEDYLCYYEDGALVVKDRATQSFEGACAALAEADPPEMCIRDSRKASPGKS